MLSSLYHIYPFCRRYCLKKEKEAKPLKSPPLLLRTLHAETLLKAINTAAAVHQLLLAGEERVTL